MTLRTLLQDRLGFDATFLHALVVVLCGVAIELAALILADAVLSNGIPPVLRNPGPEALFVFAAAGAWFLVTASLGYALAFALCLAMTLGPVLVRVLALLAAPLGTAVTSFTFFGAFAGFGGDMVYGPSPLDMLTMMTAVSYGILGLPLIAASLLAARTIRKTRVNAEAVFGGHS